MNLDKAIEILEIAKDDPDAIDVVDLFQAQDLGIEALKETARARRLGPPLPSFKLPGETKD